MINGKAGRMDICPLGGTENISTVYYVCFRSFLFSSRLPSCSFFSLNLIFLISKLGSYCSYSPRSLYPRAALSFLCASCPGTVWTRLVAAFCLFLRGYCYARSVGRSVNVTNTHCYWNQPVSKWKPR